MPSRLATLAALIALGGCAATPPASVALGTSDDGRAVALAAGQRLTVTLASNRTTGYSWALADSAGGALARDGAAVYTQDAAGPGIAGVAGREVWTFRAARAGSGTLRLVYARPFERGVAPVDTFSAPVTVR